MAKYTAGFLFWLLIIVMTEFVEAKSILPAENLFKKASQVSRSAGVDDNAAAIGETKQLIENIVAASYPELQNAKINVKIFHSQSDYFRSQFSISRFLTFRKLNFVVLINPAVFKHGAPPEGIRAIIAHELAHAVYYLRHNRIELLGLVRLTTKSFTLRFERGADLQAIRRGYGPGLKAYREWLYQNIQPAKIAEKKRDYFSPEEIDLILESISQKPGLMDFWLKNVPHNLTEIKRDSQMFNL